MRNEKSTVTQSNKRLMVDLHIISQEVFIILEVSNEEEPFLKKMHKKLNVSKKCTGHFNNTEFKTG